MCIVIGADTALNPQPAASPGRWLQAIEQSFNARGTMQAFLIGLRHL